MNDYIHPVSQQILERIEPPDSTKRRERQTAIERAIGLHNPDAWEARGLVVTLAAVLQRRFGEDAVEAALLCSHLAKALERLDCGWKVLP